MRDAEYGNRLRINWRFQISTRHRLVLLMNPCRRVLYNVRGSQGSGQSREERGNYR
jgi:hypothetical protein